MYSYRIWSLILHGYGNVLYGHGFSTCFIDAHYHTIGLFSAYIILHVNDDVRSVLKNLGCLSVVAPRPRPPYVCQ